MVLQLPTSLPCETMNDPTTSCNKPARMGTLRVVETMTNVNYVLTPICSHCITALATAAGQAAPPPSETISTQTIKQVLAARLGLEGADEVLCALRAAGTEEDDDHAGD